MSYKCPECGETMDEERTERGFALYCSTCKRYSYENDSYAQAKEELDEHFESRRESLKEMQERYGSHTFSQEQNSKGVR